MSVNVRGVRISNPDRVMYDAPKLHRHVRVAPVRAHLRHQEHPIAAIRDRAAYADLALVLVVLPRIVHEGDAGVDRRMGESRAFSRGFHVSEVVSAQGQSGDCLIRAASERPEWNAHAVD